MVLHHNNMNRLEQDMDDLKNNQKALMDRYKNIGTSVMSDADLKKQFKAEVTKDIKKAKEQVESDMQSQSGSDKGNPNKSKVSGVIGYKDSFSQNLGEWKIGGADSPHMFSIDAEAELSAGICGVAKACLNAGGEIKASFIHTVHDDCKCKNPAADGSCPEAKYHTPCTKIQVYEAAKVYASASAEAGFNGKEVVLAGEVEAGAAVEAGVTTQHAIGGDVLVRTDQKVEAGVVAKAEAEAKCGTGGCKADYEAFAGAYAKAEQTTTVGNDDVSGAMTAAVISPGAVGAGANGEVGVNDGEVTVGFGGCVAALIAGACAEVSVSVDMKPVVGFVEDDFVPAVKDAGEALKNTGEDVGQALGGAVTGGVKAVENKASNVGDKISKGDVGGAIVEVFSGWRL